MSLRRVTDERVTTIAVQDLIDIPAGSPYENRLSEVPDQDHGVEIRRVSPITVGGSNTGTGSCASGGFYSGMSDRSYLIEIDTAGAIGAATFKWSKDEGVTWVGTLIPISDTDPISLEFNLSAQFIDGLSGTSFEVGDQFSFTAEFWAEVIYVPVATKQYQVDYATGEVEFQSADAGKTVQASYEGRGSLVQADDINQILDVLSFGEVAIREIDTSALIANKAVYISGADAFGLANATDGTKPAVGFVKTVSATVGEIVIFGVLDGFVGLTPGSVYYLDSSDGAITITSPSSAGTIKQKVGRALSVSKLMVNISNEITVN